MTAAARITAAHGDYWLAGAASVPFPVAPGIVLDGYAARSDVANGTLDTLTVSALALEAGAARLTLLTADVVAIDAAVVADIKEVLGPNAGRLVVCASHTHSGPAGIIPRLHPSQSDRSNQPLRQRFLLACVKAARGAWDSLVPATLLLGRARAPGVAADRNDPFRAIDDQVTTIAVVGDDAVPLAVIVHFACHPTILGGENLYVSADFPGALRRGIRSAAGASPRPPVVLYINGAAADISTRYTRRDQTADEVARLGQLLASAARGAISRSRPLRPTLHSASTVVDLPRRPAFMPSSASEGGLARSDHSNRSPGRSLARGFIARAEGRVLRAALPTIDAPAAAEIVGAALGELAMVAIPGELLSSLGATIVEHSPAATTLVVGYANGYVGYLVDATAANTYEGLASPFSDDAGPAVVAAAIDLLAKLYVGPAQPPDQRSVQ